MIIYRVQDREGRGPFRPGFSRRWIDPIGGSMLPPFYEEFGAGVIEKLRAHVAKYGGSCGCGCSSLDGIGQWFTTYEQHRLDFFGYHVVCVEAQKIFAESKNQVVFWSAKPLTQHKGVIAWPYETPLC